MHCCCCWSKYKNKYITIIIIIKNWAEAPTKINFLKKFNGNNTKPVIYELCIQWQTRNPINSPPKILTQCWYLTSNMLIMCLQKQQKHTKTKNITSVFFCYLISNCVHRISKSESKKVENIIFTNSPSVCSIWKICIWKLRFA